MRSFEDEAATSVEADVLAAVSEDEVTEAERVQTHVPPDVPLVPRRTRQGEADVPIDVLDEARAVEAGRRRAPPNVGDADEVASESRSVPASDGAKVLQAVPVELTGVAAAHRSRVAMLAAHLGVMLTREPAMLKDGEASQLQVHGQLRDHASTSTASASISPGGVPSTAGAGAGSGIRSTDASTARPSDWRSVSRPSSIFRFVFSATAFSA